MLVILNNFFVNVGGLIMRVFTDINIILCTSNFNLLLGLLFVNIATIITISFVKEERFIKVISLIGSFIQLSFVSLMWVVLEKNTGGLQFEYFGGIDYDLSIIYHIGVDGLSFFFVFLSVLLLPICLLCSWTTVQVRVKFFNILFHIVTFLLINVFVVQDILLFYIFFESILIPMFFIIGIWGSRSRKIHAVYQFFLYTLVGSVLMLVSILYLYNLTGSTNWEILYLHEYTVLEGRLIWFTFFLSFAVKVPMVPFHIWLPEAHVEAPTAGSVLLAGILLKMGTYGLIKYSLPFFPEGTVYFQPLIFAMSLISIIYAACSTIRQIDLKKIIAYSSVGHMNYVTLGILSGNLHGLSGSVYMMLGHGLVSSGLFLCVGLLYERYHSRNLPYYGGLIFGMPLFGLCFFILTLANVSLPGTSNFVGEFLILMGIFEIHVFAGLVAGVGVILGAVYAIWLFNRVLFGNVKITCLRYFADLNKKEFLIISILILLVFITGIYPNLITDYLINEMLIVIESQL